MSENQGLVKRLPQLGKGCLELGVRKLGSSTPHTGFIKSDFADFLSFLLLLLITLLSSTPIASRVPANWELAFNIKVSRAAILLKP